MTAVESLEICVKEHGELGPRCAVAYMEYGIALLRMFEFQEQFRQEEPEQEPDQTGPEDPEPDSEDPDAFGDLALIWENLDTARQIYESSNGNQLELAKVWLALGDVAIQSGHYAQAVQECEKCVEIRELFLDEHDRELADAYFTLANAHGFLGNEEATLKFRRQAAGCLEAALGLASDEAHKAELRGLVSELHTEIRELAAGVIGRSNTSSATEMPAKRQKI
eukprot:TRINITY_DN1398_c0_g1_i3.p1 TRINITY_DN1398_c0_g1~~TRINITY_DN1398_c0_g1_i3.p1  ORF type:complete len:223 (-),score=54.62 TRINITY_DN1398_c0_g1_i3:235-903(-)